MPIITRTFTLEGDTMPLLLGAHDANLRELEKLLTSDIHVRGTELTLAGDPDDPGDLPLSQAVITSLLDTVNQGVNVDVPMVQRTVSMLSGPSEEEPSEVFSTRVVNVRGRTIRAQTAGQKHYVESIAKHTIVFGIGPAGTGKTYLAMAMAVNALRSKDVNRIILTRPAVEAGENLGFLPGTLNDKIDPYLRPLYDALRDMMEPEQARKMMDTGVIEVAPLAYMRGRTLNNAFVILDEAQNTTAEQMKMFLTRLGAGSTMVITGDSTQVDLPGGKTSGLRIARRVLEGANPDIAFIDLTSEDVVRHSLVTAIVEAYGRYDEEQAKRKEQQYADHKNGGSRERNTRERSKDHKDKA
ncbi:MULTISPECIES: PhoH family protein [Lawsonella]|jgi:phoH family protein|nr:MULTISPECIES: PhoH family protein [Lawsonella]